MKAPDDGPHQGVPPACQRGAADHDGQDGVHLDVEAGVVGVGCRDVGADHQSGDRGADGAEDVDDPDDVPCAESGQAAGDGVDADGLDQGSQCGAPGEDGGQGEDGRGDQDGDRQGEQVAGADGLVVVVGHGDDLAAGDELGDAAAGCHEHQGGDDRLHADGGDQEAVPDAEDEAGDDGDEDRRGGRHRGPGVGGGRDVGARGGAGDRHHCAD